MCSIGTPYYMLAHPDHTARVWQSVYACTVWSAPPQVHAVSHVRQLPG